jgi:hypothetical protein
MCTDPNNLFSHNTLTNLPLLTARIIGGLEKSYDMGEKVVGICAHGALLHGAEVLGRGLRPEVSYGGKKSI